MLLRPFCLRSAKRPICCCAFPHFHTIFFPPLSQCDSSITEYLFLLKPRVQDPLDLITVQVTVLRVGCDDQIVTGRETRSMVVFHLVYISLQITGFVHQSPVLPDDQPSICRGNQQQIRCEEDLFTGFFDRLQKQRLIHMSYPARKHAIHNRDFGF